MTSQPATTESAVTATGPPQSTTPPRPAGAAAPASGKHPTDQPQPSNAARPSGEIGAGILGPDPMPPITDEQREEMSRGLLEVTAEFQAEHGAFTEEERAQARAELSTLRA